MAAAFPDPGFHFTDQHRHTAQDQAKEGQTGGERLVGQQILDGIGEADNSDHTANEDGKQRSDALLKLAEQVGNRENQLVVNSHGNRHGAAADTGNHVGNSDHGAF